MEALLEKEYNNELQDLNLRKKSIYDKITLSSKSKINVILRALIISLCCFFFPLEAVVANRLQDIELSLYVENKLLSFIFSSKLINSRTFQKILDILMNIIGSKESIMVCISITYLIIHPFIGLKLILISGIAQYFVILLQIIFQAHRPFWDLEQYETICRNTYPNPSSIVFYCSFFYLYSIISFNLLKKKKFSPLQKLIMSFCYILLLIALLIMLGGTYLLYIHQIIYTFIISIVIISLLIDVDTNIHNFIFNSLKNVYNTRIYKMKIFFYVCGLYFIGFISLYFIEENDVNKIKDIMRQNKNCNDNDIELFGIKQGFLYITLLGGIVGAFWGASFTVEKKVGKWWSKRSKKKSIIKIIIIIVVCGIFIFLKYILKIINSKYEIYFTFETILDFYECYCIFGPLTLFFQHMGYNEQYITKSYEKINVNLRDEEDIQFYRTSIFENEKKGKKIDEFVVIDKMDNINKNTNIKDTKENEKKSEIDNLNKNKNINNLYDIYEEKGENEEEENEIYQPTSTIIKNVRKHEDEEPDFEFYIDNENKNNKNINEPPNELNSNEE